MSIDVPATDQDPVGFPVGILALTLTVPTYLNYRALVDGLRSTSRRRRALGAEQQRLMALGRARAGGPTGGPAVTGNRWRNPVIVRPFYTPPVDDVSRVLGPPR